jgi:hypothetical protein
VKTTLHHVNPGEHPLPQIASTNHSGPSKRTSKFLSYSPFKSSKIPELINGDAANSVSIMLATAQRIDLDANIRASVR